MKDLSGWKKELATFLKKLGLVKEDQTGKIIINMNQGGVTDVEKTEKMK